MSEGFLWQHEGAVVTVFSAPNYCYRCGNKAAIVDIDENMNHKVRKDRRRGGVGSQRTLSRCFAGCWGTGKGWLGFAMHCWLTFA